MEQCTNALRPRLAGAAAHALRAPPP